MIRRLERKYVAEYGMPDRRLKYVSEQLYSGRRDGWAAVDGCGGVLVSNR